jgi:8-oxo-dGTP diphosphatase
MPELVYEWVTIKLPENVSVQQVYAFILDKYGRVFLQDDNGRFNLPGGKPEGNENCIQTLDREIMEESSLLVKDYQYLGYVNIREQSNHLEKKTIQVRYYCSLAKVLPNQPDPSTGKIYKRLFCTIDRAREMLGWGLHLDLQLDELKRKISQIRFKSINDCLEVQYIDELRSHNR